MATKKVNLNNEGELQPEVVLDMLAKRGLIAENAADPERIKKAKQEQKKQAYHNTEMLLKHYRKVTAGMQKYGVMLYHSVVPGTLNVVPITYTNKSNKTCNEVIVYADTTYTWVNTDNPEERIENTWVFVGQMEDAAQAFGAAETYANRYYLMKSLQLATTESDPDNYRSKQQQAEDFEQNEAKKRLGKAIKEVVDAGSALIKGGLNKADMMNIVAKHNGGNGNPSSISSEEVCKKILTEFESVGQKVQQ